jgi:hypothetical protein
MKLNKPKPLSVAVLAALLVASSGNLLAETAKPATAAAPAAVTTAPTPDAAKPDAAPAQTPITVDEGTAVTNEQAMQALTHFNVAHVAIEKKDIKAAQEALGEADKLLKSIKDSLPTAKIKQTLEAAKATPDTADWTSIYQQLDQIRVFLPSVVAKQAVGKPATADTAKDSSASKDTTPAPSAESLDAVLVALQYTEIDLPVKSAISAVEKSQQALKKENLPAAGKALQEAENNIVVLQGVVEEPLSQAHLSLWQSLANLKKGSVNDAKRYLKDAIGFLETAAQSTDKTTKEAGEKLLTEGKALQAELDKQSADQTSTDTAGINSKLERFGLHTEAWAERAINYAYTKTAEATGNALKDELIEARFHLTNASIELGTAQEPAAAKQELEQAQTFLKQALQQTDDLWADASYKQQVTDMQAQVDKLLQGQPEQLASSSTQLHQIRQALQTVIHNL